MYQNALKDCLAEQNQGNAGISISSNSRGDIENCASKSNSAFGVFIDILSYGFFKGSGDYSSNGSSGIYVGGKCCVWYYTNYSGQIQNNSGYGLWVRY